MGALVGRFQEFNMDGATWRGAVPRGSVPPFGFGQLWKKRHAHVRAEVKKNIRKKSDWQKAGWNVPGDEPRPQGPTKRRRYT